MGDRARTAALALHGIAESEGDWGLLALEDVRDLFRAQASLPDGDKLTSAHIVQALAGMEHRPWPEHANGRPISTRGLAKLLGRFGIESRNVRLGGETPKGYVYADCIPAFTRYLPTPFSQPPHPPHSTAEADVADVADTKRGIDEEIDEGFL